MKHKVEGGDEKKKRSRDEAGDEAGDEAEAELSEADLNKIWARRCRLAEPTIFGDTKVA